MRWPECLPRNHVFSSLVSGVDVAPTVLDLLGLAPVERRDGRSVVGRITGTGPAKDRGSALAECMLFAEEHVALRTLRYKYIRWADGREQAYDLRNDPQERIDLAGVQGVVAPLRRRLNALNDQLRQTSDHLARIDPGTRRAMMALGYIGPE